MLQALWKKSPMMAQEIIDALSGHPKTIKTYLSRLGSKGVIGFEKEVRRYSCFPKVEKKECEKSISLDFLNRVFKGALVPLILAVQWALRNRWTPKWRAALWWLVVVRKNIWANRLDCHQL